jgi:hypothetical protein
LADEGTFAADAQDGVYYDIMCLKCRRQTSRSARQFCAMGHGQTQVVGIRKRLRCDICGNLGATITLRGYWTGPHWSKPADWAETVESRVPPDE